RCNGNILLRGPSVMQGYLKNEDTEAVLTTDGYLVTGDRGYMTDGAVVVTGRAKDMFLVNGRNVWPEDIEWIALNEASLRHGQAVAFDLDREDGTSEINLLVQHPPDPHLRRRIVEALSSSLGIGCRVIFVAPQTIPLTSSGKLQ